MSPLRVLTRGYSLAEDERGALIRSAAQLHPGDRVRLRFAVGGADCTVDSVKEGE
jgi:exodeoxyribonuclease VII large subunit